MKQLVAKALILAVIVQIGGPLSVLPVATAASCGEIITPYPFHDGRYADGREPITDCDNPFAADTTVAELPYEFTIDGEPVSPGTVLNLPSGTFDTKVTFRIVEPEFGRMYEVYFFTKTPEGLAEKYRHFTGGDRVSFTLSLPAGEYIAVLVDSLAPQLSTTQGKRTLTDFLIPTAHAAESIEEFKSRTVSIPFTIKRQPATPAGRSSVLFLPGIKGSKLYKDGLLGSEDQLWLPTLNLGQDLGQLAMTPAGASVEEVYTRDVLETVVGVGDIYGSFLTFLTELETAEKPIKEHVVFAYDWRLSVEEVAVRGARYEAEMRDLAETVADMAARSHTGRVSIVAHSNGGLLAKALLARLEVEGRAELVDRLILVASPQLGTPQAIGAFLHGYKEGANGVGNLALTALGARDLLQNMPGAYGLVPGPRYHTDASLPVVMFEPGSTTAPLREQYGSALLNTAALIDFMTDARWEESNELYRPYPANETLLRAAVSAHEERLDGWTAPGTLAVTEVVGVGRPTVAALLYRSLTERTGCVTAGPGPIVCAYEELLKPYTVLSLAGDETVTTLSAAAYPGEKDTYYLDLSALNAIAHGNVMGAAELQELIDGVLSGESPTAIDHLTTTRPEVDTTYDVISMDSPVRLLATDRRGRQTGVLPVEDAPVVTDIPGSRYFELGDTKYLVLPREADSTITLYGEEHGSYTLTVATLRGDMPATIEALLQDATTTPTMLATLERVDAIPSGLSIDYDGDGAVDARHTLAGEFTLELPPAPTEPEVPDESTPTEPAPREETEPGDERERRSQATRIGSRQQSPEPVVAGIAISLTLEKRTALYAALVELQAVLVAIEERIGNQW